MNPESSAEVVLERRYRRVPNGDRPEMAVASDVAGMPAAQPPEGPAWDATVDPARGRFPCCLCWSPIHPITWLFPFIGHMGVADSDGITYDFAGGINVGRMAFGPPTRYVQLDPRRALPRGADSPHGGWDEGLRAGVAHYEATQRYDFCTNNCHSFAADILNRAKYAGKDGWTMLHLGAWVVLLGSFTGVGGVVASLGPPVIVLAGCALFFGPTFLWFWLGSSAAILAIFAALVTTGAAAPKAAQYMRAGADPAPP